MGKAPARSLSGLFPKQPGHNEADRIVAAGLPGGGEHIQLGEIVPKDGGELPHFVEKIRVVEVPASLP